MASELKDNAPSPSTSSEESWSKPKPQSHPCTCRRHGVQQQFIDVIAQIYANPLFRVQAAGARSTTRAASTGIRQGCPLSPYLFLVIHSATMHNVEEALYTANHSLPTIHSVDTPLFELACADDTILVGRNYSTVQQALHNVEKVAKLYNLKLNMAK